MNGNAIVATGLQSSSASRLKLGQNRFFDHLIGQNERAEFWRTVFNLSMVVTGGLLAGIGKLSGLAEPHGTWMSAVGLSLVAVGTFFVTIFDFRRSRLVTEAKNALSLADEFMAEKETLERQQVNAELLDQRRRFLLIAIQRMHEAVERMPHGTALVTAIEAMLDAGSSDLEGAIGFDAGEKWAFSIFQRRPDPDGGRTEVMQRIVVSFADRQREKTTPSGRPELKPPPLEEKRRFYRGLLAT